MDRQQVIITQQPDGAWFVDCGICGWHTFTLPEPLGGAKEAAERRAVNHKCSAEALAQYVATIEDHLELSQQVIAELYQWIVQFDRNPCSITSYLSSETDLVALAALAAIAACGVSNVYDEGESG